MRFPLAFPILKKGSVSKRSFSSKKTHSGQKNSPYEDAREETLLNIKEEVLVSSVTGPLVGISGSTVYGTAKAGMLGMTRSLAIEIGSHNITINCVGPGWIKTSSSSESEITAGKYTPVGRLGTPNEVGHVAVFLAGEEASYVNGQLIVVDGGNTVQEYKVALQLML